MTVNQVPRLIMLRALTPREGATKSNSISGGGGNGGLAIDPDFQKTEKALWAILIPVTVLEISMIVLGAVYKESCPYERMIPVYLIVKGSLVVINIFFHFLYQFVFIEPENSQTRTKRGITFLVNCFLAVWTTVGNAWVLRFQRPVLDDVTNPLYCHVTLYRFAFAVTIIEDVVILLGILGLIASLMYSFIKVSRTVQVLPVLPLYDKYRQKQAQVKRIPTQVTEIDLE